MVQMGFSTRWVNQWDLLCRVVAFVRVIILHLVYLLCAESLICTDAPIISHIFFADDYFLFFWACERETVAMKNILATYEESLGQAINLQKS